MILFLLMLYVYLSYIYRYMCIANSNLGNDLHPHSRPSHPSATIRPADHMRAACAYVSLPFLPLPLVTMIETNEDDDRKIHGFDLSHGSCYLYSYVPLVYSIKLCLVDTDVTQGTHCVMDPPCWSHPM